MGVCKIIILKNVLNEVYGTLLYIQETHHKHIIILNKIEQFILPLSTLLKM